MTTADEGDGSPETNRYEYSGIEERHGTVPLWLIAVYLSLAIWMVYYLVHYWTDKG